MKQTVYLPSKPRYEILDGLRGVAALLVVAYHLFETYASSPATHIVNHGYLAVDFFFVLSGYVVGYAYDDRWGRMSVGAFFKRRLVRLHPLIVLGTLIGLLTFYLGGSPAFPQVDDTAVWMLLLVALLGVLMVPCPRFLDIRGWQDFAPLNGAAWSLVWEYVANILYAIFFRHFRTWVLVICVLLSASLTLLLAFNVDVFGVLATRTAGAPFSVNGGFGFAPDQLVIGLTRLLYPFFVGLLLSRLKVRLSTGKSFWCCTLLIISALAMPHLGSETPWFEGVYNSAVVLLLFPLIVVMGAGGAVSGRSASVCRWLGRISYPLYITHQPWLYVQMAWAKSHEELPLSVHIAVAVGLFIGALLIAQASLVLYDEPLRDWLKRKWLMKPSKA